MAQINLPPKLVPVFTPVRGEVRFRGAYGGRGSGKSFSFALMAAVYGYAEKLRILCTREFQVSIKESFHAELKNAINSQSWLSAHYDVGVDYISGKNGTEFIFRGLRNNIGSIKSLAQIDICIIEEAEDTPEYALQALEPTIRAEKSEIWCIWNPCIDGSPIDNRFIKYNDPDAVIAKVNWSDNPWFPSVLDRQRLKDKDRMLPEVYNHVWEGDYLSHSDVQIFRNKYIIDEFVPKHDWDGPYLGMDFGFSVDPTVMVKCWIYDEKLYIEYEAGKVGLEINDTAKFMTDRIPGVDDNKIVADSARPETISTLKKQHDGLRGIVGAEKGKGSVEDGIEHIRSFEKVVIHPRCVEVKREFDTYSYKTDRLTGDVTSGILDKNNHYIDAIRYAIEPVMKNGKLDDWGSLL